ncbi:MAG: hypothetical protein RQ753_09305, partial [Desulfurivibrionaceae bacterium]|nr:hypothetical protein [Desulfurivibrionaceae bacterium]
FGNTTSKTDPGDSTYLVGAGVDFKVNDKLTLGALLGYLMASENGIGGDDKTLVEYDLSARYQIAQNASYHIGVAYGTVDNFSPADDAVVAIGNGIDVKW